MNLHDAPSFALEDLRKRLEAHVIASEAADHARPIKHTLALSIIDTELDRRERETPC